MVNNLIKIVLVSLFVAPALFAQEAGELSLDTWIEENVGSGNSYPYRIIVLESGFNDDGNPVFADVSNDAVDSISYFKQVNVSSLSWDFKINHKSTEGLSSREILEKFTTANYYLFAPKTGNVVFARRSATGVIEEMFSAKAKADTKWEAMFYWVQKRFGWDGVVLASAGNRFIVGSPARLLKESDIQALAIAGSKETEILEKSDRAGAGLLSLVKKYNGFGVFEAVFVDDKVAIEVGTKLIIERRRK